MKKEIEFKQYACFLLLNALYRKTKGSTVLAEDLFQIAILLNIKDLDFEDILEGLSEGGFVKRTGMGSPLFFLTHVGKKEIERAYSFPNERSEHFPSLKDMGITKFILPDAQ